MASMASPLTGKTAGMKSGIKGLAKPAAKAKKPTPKTSITVEGAVDLSDGKFPKIPATKGPVLPVDDAFAKLRTQQT